MLRKLYHVVVNRENWLALVLALILVALVIFTADTSSTWIYQGF
jgi:general stress protein CsbA